MSKPGHKALPPGIAVAVVDAEALEEVAEVLVLMRVLTVVAEAAVEELFSQARRGSEAGPQSDDIIV